MSDAVLHWFDTHCHVDEPAFDDDREQVLARARASGVHDMIVIGAVGDIASASRAVALAECSERMWATVATHPHDVAAMTEAWWQEHERLLSHPKVVAVGETGLDYYYEHSSRELQQAAFIRFCRLANAYRKPLVCHIRDAHGDAQAILDAHRGDVPVIIHCFTGTPDDAAIYAARGYYVSFSGIVTYKNAGSLREALHRVPVDQILLETDCPYLSPLPLRGRRNEPAHLPHTGAVVATELGLSIEKLSKITSANARSAFSIHG